jgi:DNA repair protein RecN (Recombination protein N)
LRFELAEIDAVAPMEGEEDRLEAELRRLEHAEGLAEASGRAAAAIADDGGARDALGSAVALLRGVAGLDDDLEVLRGRAEGLAAEAQDLAMELAGYAQGVAGDAARLEELRGRRAALAGLCRKYGPDATAVVAYATTARGRVTELDGGEERAQGLSGEVAELWQEVGRTGAALRSERAQAGRRLADQVERYLEELAMAGARMEVAVEESEPGPVGADRIIFQLAANPGEPMLPLGKAASGGERSRVALAVRLALADVDETPVLVFDEVDAGIGGKVAVEVGRKLGALARGRQVLCVTHLAQLAAFADVHFLVEKGMAEGERTVATVRALDEDERVTELSRMLSGSPDSELAAGHAAELRAGALAASAADDGAQ